jgi:hypothetical protein
MKTIKVTLVIMIATLLSSCSNYWILDKERIDEIPKIASYTKKMRDFEDSNDTKLSAHKVFTINDDRKCTPLIH